MWVLQTLIGGLLYMKSEKRRKIVKALRSTLKWEVDRVNTHILKCHLHLVAIILISIVGYIDNMLLATILYC